MKIMQDLNDEQVQAKYIKKNGLMQMKPINVLKYTGFGNKLIPNGRQQKQIGIQTQSSDKNNFIERHITVSTQIL